MTTELEQEFFDTFGIENRFIIQTHEKLYPEITAEKLLEMICICNSTYINGYTNYFIATGKSKEELKEEILKKCITLSGNGKSKIQQLFNEDDTHKRTMLNIITDDEY